MWCASKSRQRFVVVIRFCHAHLLLLFPKSLLHAQIVKQTGKLCQCCVPSKVGNTVCQALICAALESRQRTAVFDIFLLLPSKAGNNILGRYLAAAVRKWATIFVGYLAAALKSRQHFVCPQLNTRRNLISLLWSSPLSLSHPLYLFNFVCVCVCVLCGHCARPWVQQLYGL